MDLLIISRLQFVCLTLSIAQNYESLHVKWAKYTPLIIILNMYIKSVLKACDTMADTN